MKRSLNLARRRSLGALLGLVILSLAGPLADRAYARSEDAVQKDVAETAKKLAKSKKVEERADAAGHLGRMRPQPEAVPPLVAALADPAAEVRKAAAGALWKLHKLAEPARPALRKALDDPDTGVALNAAGALDALGVAPAELKATYERGLTSRDPDERFIAARGLIGVAPGTRLLPIILEDLRRQAASPGSMNLRMAAAALDELVATGDRALVPPSLDALSDGAVAVRRAIVNAYSTDAQASAFVTGFVRATSDADATVRRAAVAAGMRMAAPPPEFKAAVEKALQDTNDGVRETAAIVINQFQANALRSNVEQAVRSGQGVAGVQAALDGARAQGSGGAVGGLIVTLRTGSSERARIQAASALAQMAEAADVVAPALVGALLRDPSASVRAAAGQALAELPNVSDEAAVVQALLPAVPKEKDGAARAAGYLALGANGRHLRENQAAVVAALTAALRDPDPVVQRVAEKALRSYK